MIFLHEIIIKKLVATHVFFELLIISFLCYYCSLLSEFWDLLFTITAACFYSISFSRFFFSLSLNFWNSSQPILFGGMLMAKFAALSNHTTSKCQRRKGKRCRIPKVKTNTKQQICIYYNNQILPRNIRISSASCYILFSLHKKRQSFEKKLYKKCCMLKKTRHFVPSSKTALELELLLNHRKLIAQLALNWMGYVHFSQ